MKIILLIITVLLLAFRVNSQTPNADRLSHEMDSLMTAISEYELFNGAVLVAEEDDVVYKNAFGKANFEWGIPNTTDTKFLIGSITKTFTAVLTLRLVELEKINLDDVITDHLEDYPSETGDKIKIEHLLVQSSGIPDYIELHDFLSTKALQEHDKDEFPKFFADLELEFEPGTDWNYGNSGYYLLGLIIEEVTGVNYDEAMQKHILEPAGLENTGYAWSSEIIENLAAGYVTTPEGIENAPYIHSSAGYSAGMMYSTVEDLFEWTRRLNSGDVIENDHYFINMITPQKEDYGFGIFVGEQRIGDHYELVFGHAGTINGFSSQLTYLSDSDYTIIIMDNTQQCTSRIYFALRDLIFGKDAPEISESMSQILGRKVASEGVDAAVELFYELRENNPELCQDYSEFSRLTDFYMQRDQIEKAIEIFRLKAEIFPSDSSILVDKGNAYLDLDQKEKAHESFKKAIEINPRNETAQAKLRELEQTSKAW